MADISAEIAAFQSAVYGEDVRTTMVNLANKLNNESSAAATTVAGYDTRLSAIEYADGCSWIKELYINEAGVTYDVSKVGTFQETVIDGVTNCRLRFTSSDGQSFTGNSAWFPKANPPFYPIEIQRGVNVVGYILADFAAAYGYHPFNVDINVKSYHLDMSPTIKLYREYGVLDATLSHAGQSADAKVTGDAIDGINQSINDLGLPYKEIVDNETDFTESDIVLHGGSTRAFGGWMGTDFISCLPGQTFEYTASSFNKTASGTLYQIDAISFFDSNKTYVDGIYSTSSTTGAITMSGTFVVPSGVNWIRVMLNSSATPNPRLARLGSGVFESENIHAKVCFVGDSLTQGFYSGTSGNFVFVNKPYPTIFKEIMKKRGFAIDAKNYGRRGLSPVTYWQNAIPSNSTYHSPASGEPGDTIDFDNNVDCVIIMLGTNGHIDAETEADAKALIESVTSGQTYPYTVPSEQDGTSYERNTVSYCNIIEYIMNETSHHAQIILVAPVYACDSKKDKIIKTLNMIKALSERYQIPYINATFESGIGDFNKGVFYNQGDFLHLNQAGYHKFGTFIASKFIGLYSTFNMDEIPVT